MDISSENKVKEALLTEVKLTGDLSTDPNCKVDGHTYYRGYIQEQLARGGYIDGIKYINEEKNVTNIIKNKPLRLTEKGENLLQELKEK